MANILPPTVATLDRDLLAGFAPKRGADELVNLVRSSAILDLHTDGPAAVFAATVDYSPAILASHATDVLTAMVRNGYISPNERKCFEILVLPANKGNDKKGIAPDPGAIAIVKNQPSEYRLAGAKADEAHKALMAGAQQVASTVLPAYRRAIAEANLENFPTVETEETVDQE